MRLRNDRRQADGPPEVRSTPGLTVEPCGVRQRYGRGAGSVHAPTRIGLVPPRGTFVVIPGPSGSGRSTFPRCAADGLDRPSAGWVRPGGTEFTATGEERRITGGPGHGSAERIAARTAGLTSRTAVTAGATA